MQSNVSRFFAFLSIAFIFSLLFAGAPATVTAQDLVGPSVEQVYIDPNCGERPVYFTLHVEGGDMTEPGRYRVVRGYDNDPVYDWTDFKLKAYESLTVEVVDEARVEIQVQYKGARDYPEQGVDRTRAIDCLPYS